MTLVSQLITDAYREGNLIAVGKTPTTDEKTEALGRFNSFMLGLYGYDLGENLVDWQVPGKLRTAPVAADFPQLPYPSESLGFFEPLPLAADATNDVWPYPPQNSRIVFGGTSNVTVYFTSQPNDGARMAFVANGDATGTITLDGNGRTIEGATSQAYSAPYAARQWLYRADLGDWVVVTTLALTDQCPFPAELDDLWVCGLAIRLAPRYGKQIHEGTAAAFAAAKKTMKTRYKQAMKTVYGAQNLPPSWQSYSVNRWHTR